MPRPKKVAVVPAGTDTPVVQEPPKVAVEVELPPRAELPALLAKAKKDGDTALIVLILDACSK